MKASIAIVASALATQSFAGAALYMMECAGGSALLYIKGWSWEGGLKDKEEFDKTPPEDEECELDGSSTDGDCEIRDYKFHISGSAPDGCHSALDVTEGYITTPDGEEVSITEDDRCEEIEYCVSVGIGGCDYNGWQCDI